MNLIKSIKNIGFTLAGVVVLSTNTTASYVPKEVIKTAKSYLGTKYRYGGCSKHGLDCSGFVKIVFKKHGKKLPRTSRKQASVGKHIAKSSLKMGDLVFFSSRKTKGIAHVGIFIGGGKFIHASSGKHKVTISKLSKHYYSKHYKGARRL
jgi:cell wall-associated NlpC family hydrolase